MKVLYHYTSMVHLPRILQAGFLKLTESNLRLDRVGYKPVVWLTEDSNVVGHGLEGSSVDKTEVKITVEHKKSYDYWKAWSRKNKIPKQWAAALERKQKPETWWVSTTVIPLKDIIKIENRYTGEVYYINPAYVAGY